MTKNTFICLKGHQAFVLEKKHFTTSLRVFVPVSALRGSTHANIWITARLLFFIIYIFLVGKILWNITPTIAPTRVLVLQTLLYFNSFSSSSSRWESNLFWSWFRLWLELLKEFVCCSLDIPKLCLTENEPLTHYLLFSNRHFKKYRNFDCERDATYKLS